MIANAAPVAAAPRLERGGRGPAALTLATSHEPIRLEGTRVFALLRPSLDIRQAKEEKRHRNRFTPKTCTFRFVRAHATSAAGHNLRIEAVQWWEATFERVEKRKHTIGRVHW